MQKTEENVQLCPACLEDKKLDEKYRRQPLDVIPAREGRKKHLWCWQCQNDFPCDDNGRRIITENIYFAK